MDTAIGLARLEDRVASDLQKIAWPQSAWVKPRRGPDGEIALNVLIIGAGQGGLTLGLQLHLDRVDRVMIVDRAPPEARGPWKTYGRMITLRSPKFTTGPDLDIPSLTFQSWYVAQWGEAAWQALGKIPKAAWSDYLAWYQRVLELPVEQGVTAGNIRPMQDVVAVDLQTPAGLRTVHARHVVLATGIESTGRWWMPEYLRKLPAHRCQHASEAIDFAKLAGRTVAVLGAGASAFDNAATALEAGARAVHVFWRREQLQRVQPYKHISYTGFLRHLGDLPDDKRWRIMRHLLTLREAFPAETWARVTRHQNAHLHAACDWSDATLDEDGAIAIHTLRGAFRCDHVIVGTGFEVDTAVCPLLGPLSSRIARWCDRYQPPDELRDDRLAQYPYLGQHFQMLPRSGQTDQALSRLKLFTFGATMSFGPSGASINALKFAVPRLVRGITQDLFDEGADHHLDDLLGYDTPEFDLTLERDRVSRD